MAESERAFVRETCAKVRWPRWTPGNTGVTWVDWLSVHGPLVDAWLAAGECLVYDLDGIAVGFLLRTGDVLRMLYTKADFRQDRSGVRRPDGEPRVGTRLIEAMLTPGCVLPAYRTTPSFRAFCAYRHINYGEVRA